LQEIKPNTVCGLLKKREEFVMKKRCIFNSLVLVGLVLALWSVPVFAYEPYFYIIHRVNSDLVNGKSSYSNSHFNRVHIDVTTDNAPTSTATLTVKGGSYSYGTWNGLWDDLAIERVTASDRTFNLRYNTDYEAIVPVNSAGEEVVFWGAADTGFSEKEFTYTIDGVAKEGRVPKIRSTSEQLATYVPYIECVFNQSNYLTGLKIRFVNPSNPSQTLTKSSTANVGTVDRILIWGADDNYIRTINANKTYSDGELLEGTVDYSEPVNPSQVYGIEIRFSDDNQVSGVESWYRWNFYVDDLPLTGSGSSSSTSSSSGGGGGCNTASGSFAVFALTAAILAMKKRGRNS
jgi:hypothetical protein